MTAPSVQPEAIPAELRALPQWVAWRYETRGDKRTKIPKNPKSNGKLVNAKPNDPATWGTFDEAVDHCGRHADLAGIGFCLAPDDGLTGIDLDHVLDPDTGELKPEAAEILERFAGTYCEVSPSGTGLRLFTFGKPGRSGKNAGRMKWCEVYSHPSSRYLTVTGNHWTGSATAVTEQQDALDWLHRRFMTASTGSEKQASAHPVDANARPLNLDDAALLDKARTAKNGADFERLWSGDTSAHGGDESAADLALCNLLAFWTGGDAARVDRLFRQSGLFRSKWDSKRGDAGTYGAWTVNKAVAGCKEFYGDRQGVRSEAPAHAPTVAAVDSESEEFNRHDTRLRRKSGSSEVLKSLLNAITICENLINGLIGFNAFRQRIEARIPAPWRKSPGAWGDYDTAELAAIISSRYFPDFSIDKLLTAIMVVARRNEFNPAQDRLRALTAQWDGVSRLTTWLADYLNAELTPTNREYLAEIGAAWLKGVVARVLFPGCKRDDVLVMRSPQGYLKSTAAQAIADSIMPDAFTDCIGNIDSKDAKADIRGVIIAELGELAALSKSSIEGIKAFVATRSDHFRESYGKLASDYPRTVSFIGTTNDDRFLKDPTGNRRWWPITITAPIDIPRLEAALPQLMGEAASRVLAGDAWHVKDERALQQAETIRSDCFDHDVWTEAALRAAEHMADSDGYATVAGILEKMQVQTHMQTTSAQIRVGGILRVAGWTSKRRRVCRRLIVAWSPQGVHPSHRVNTEGDTQKHSQTAGVHPVSPCSPYFGDEEKNEGGEPTPATTNCSPTERDIDCSTDIGCTPCYRVNTEANSGDSSITLPVHPQKIRVNMPKTDTPPPPQDISADTPTDPPPAPVVATSNKVRFE